MLLIFLISSPNDCDGSDVDKKDMTLVHIKVENEAYGVFGVWHMVDNKSNKKILLRGRGQNLRRDSEDKELANWKRERDEGVEALSP